MTNTNNSASGGGIGFLGALALLFIGLKLTGYIGWSWIWVLSPLWLPIVAVLAVAVVIVVLTVLGYGLAAGVRAIVRKRKHNALKKRLGL
jgi:hypothetical protein